jgi:hypothetical protein
MLLVPSCRIWWQRWQRLRQRGCWSMLYGVISEWVIIPGKLRITRVVSSSWWIGHERHSEHAYPTRYETVHSAKSWRAIKSRNDVWRPWLRTSRGTNPWLDNHIIKSKTKRDRHGRQNDHEPYTITRLPIIRSLSISVSIPFQLISGRAGSHFRIARHISNFQLPNFLLHRCLIKSKTRVSTETAC